MSSQGAEANAVTAAKIAYKPVGLALGVASGMIAGVVFKQEWKATTTLPDATDENRTWQKDLSTAAAHGAISAVVKAAVDRAGATTTTRLTAPGPAEPSNGGTGHRDRGPAPQTP
ncbi:DUF4235 domain-containing protein [Streptomyces sp. NPDC056491]|uniref:DUF4235 domain-containing protein n=1 Tax=Streptomyces sp. NPDC056491 TaxID=3345837 RepID=UPI0036B26B19